MRLKLCSRSFLFSFPPAYAYVIGDQHVVTFDRKHYNFAGRCSYILARDMVDDRFTVVLNYNNRPRQPQVQSLVVLLRGVAIEVGRDSKVGCFSTTLSCPCPFLSFLSPFLCDWSVCFVGFVLSVSLHCLITIKVSHFIIVRRQCVVVG